MAEIKGDNDQIVRGSGNVYRDLGLKLTPEDELKIEIARQITRVIAHRGYTQVDVGRILGTDQSKVSKITRGRLKEFTADRLFRYLLALGVNLDVHVSDVAETKNAHAGRVKFYGKTACG